MQKKQQNKHFNQLILSLALFFASVAIFSSRTYAQEIAPDSSIQGTPPTVSCGDASVPSYNALFPSKPGSYDVYVKLGKITQPSKVTLSYQGFSSPDCKTIGSVAANGEEWTKIGDWNPNQEEALSTFVLSSDSIKGLPDANRPTVLIVSKTDPVCIPAKECATSVDGRVGSIKAAGTLANEDSLRILQAQNPAEDTLVRVDYYVDNKPAYSSSTIEPFNLHYVGGGEHLLTTVATYKSNQQVVFTDNISHGLSYEVSYILYSFFFANRTLILIVVGSLIVWMVISVSLFAAREIYRRRKWQEQHFQYDSDYQASHHSLLPRHHYAIFEKFPVVFAKRGGFVVGLITISVVLMVVINSYILGIYSVDGPSMEDTLHTGETLVVNKTVKTWDKISRREYTPKRNQIIVFSKQADILFDPSEGVKTSYVVKRVIALPGERITVDDKGVKVYNEKYPDGFNPEESQAWTAKAHLNNQVDIDVTLGPDELFIMGDNRPESIDSRSYGAIKLDKVQGNVLFK